MATSEKSDLMPPENVPAYVAAHPVGKQIVLPDLKNPGKSVAYTIQETLVADAKPHPKTGAELKRVTLVLKN